MSSLFFKNVSDQIEVDGIDIADYNQTEQSKRAYSRYIISEPTLFHNRILNLPVDYNYIISNHNIEHCNEPEKVFTAMVERLAPHGELFIATPSLASVGFPNRRGTLNFRDDSTHKEPVNLEQLWSKLAPHLECQFFAAQYHPPLWKIVGLINEHKSKETGRVMLGTWDLYGFEQIIWLKKR